MALFLSKVGAIKSCMGECSNYVSEKSFNLCDDIIYSMQQALYQIYDVKAKNRKKTIFSPYENSANYKIEQRSNFSQTTPSE